MQGIATLPYEVYELPMVPEGGIQQYEQAADMLAEFGRNGDTYIVHAAEGETMVPMEVLSQKTLAPNNGWCWFWAFNSITIPLNSFCEKRKKGKNVIIYNVDFIVI